MPKGLKCPKCKQQTAYHTYGTTKDARRYKQKLCNCGYKGARKYRPYSAY